MAHLSEAWISSACFMGALAQVFREPLSKMWAVRDVPTPWEDGPGLSLT